MTSLLRLSTRALLASLMLTALACDPSDACDPGTYEEHGLCHPLPQPAADAGGDASSGDGEDAGDEADAEPPSDPYEGFGDECADQADCPNGLICGAPMLPMCTQINCLQDESICPPAWTCLDVAGLSPDPNVTSICFR